MITVIVFIDHHYRQLPDSVANRQPSIVLALHPHCSRHLLPAAYAPGNLRPAGFRLQHRLLLLLQLRRRRSRFPTLG